MSRTDISLSETRSTKHHIITSAALRIVSTRSKHPPFSVSMLKIIKERKKLSESWERLAQSSQTEH